MPALRGVSHLLAFFFSIALGAVVLVAAPGVMPRLAVAVFAASVTAMFGASGLYHRIDWTPGTRPWIRRADHSTVYLCIAGGYTVYALLVLSGAWMVAILAAVWVGVIAAIVLKFAWIDGPRWLAASIAIALGWVGLSTIPQAFAEIDHASIGLIFAGGLLYTVGAATYMLRRPDPFPRVFGFHEVFHLLVVGAVACHYTAVALFAVI